MDSSIVIKVQYEETLRRFYSRIVNDVELELNMVGLREKIVSLFNFAPDTQFDLTYEDEDGDLVALVDDDELRDAVRQWLNPLRITVSLNSAKSLNSSAHSSASSIPSISAPTREKIQNLNSNVSEILKSLPEPLREPVSKLSSNLAKKATYSASSLAEITDSLMKLGLHYLNQLPELPSSVESKKSVEAYQDSDGIKSLVVPTEATPGGSCGKPTSEAKNVLLKSIILCCEKGCAAPGSKSSAPSGSVSNNSSQPLNPVIPNAHGASMDKQGINETSEMTGVKLFDAPPSESNCSPRNNWIDYSRRWWRPSDGSQATSVKGWTKTKGVSISQYSLFPPVPSTSMNECPFTGMPITNDKAIPHDAPSGKPETIYNYSNGIFHRGIRCDGCDVHPITGPRFKSKVREDYDLCSICFAEVGNSADFMRIDHPVVHHHPPSFKGSFCHLPQKFKRHFAESTPLELDSRFILDVNILDGTIMAPLTRFTKIWRMRNSGTTVWPQGTRLDWIGGVKMTTSPSIELEITAAGVKVGHELDVAVDFVAPELHGRHISYWRMALPTGERFGQRVWVLIEVNASLKKPIHAAKPDFNLNLPPTSANITAPKVVVPIPVAMMNHNLPENNMSNESVADVIVSEPMMNQSLQHNMPNVSGETVDVPIPEPTMDQRLPEHNMSNASSVGTSGPVINGQVSKEQEAKFPIDDSLLVGGNKYHAAQSLSVSYPIIDLTEEIEPTVSAPSGMAILASDEVDAGAQTEEEKLLKELEEMGFKHAALNKEVLKMNKNDLEQTIDDLCGGSEWDPILEELEEMGFYDRSMNKRLLRKNDGSIKRVVMDLIAEE